MKKLGVNFIEFNIKVLSDLSSVVPNIKGMHTSFHLPIVDDDGWDFSCLNFSQEIDQTIGLLNQNRVALGLHHIVSHPSEAPFASSPMPSDEESMFAALSRLDTPIYFENIAKWSPDQFHAFYVRAKNRLGDRCAGMCYDAAHFSVSGYDPVEQFHNFHDIIGCVHLSDSRGTEDAHLPFGVGGDLPIADLINTMIEHKFTGPITLEIRPPSAGELGPYIRSYITLLRNLDRQRYHQARMRLLLLRPLLHYLAK
jgi:sugar phosphate isomerase/epimerase